MEAKQIRAAIGAIGRQIGDVETSIEEVRRSMLQYDVGSPTFAYELDALLQYETRAGALIRTREAFEEKLRRAIDAEKLVEDVNSRIG